MKLSEFALTHIKGKTPIDLEYFAEVSVTTAHCSGSAQSGARFSVVIFQ